MSPEMETLIGLSVLRDAVRQADAEQWRRRAEEFEWAKPSINMGEHEGDGDLERLRVAWRRCHAAAQACRNKAEFIEWCERDDIQRSQRWESVADQLAVDILMWEQRKAGRPALTLLRGDAA